MRTKLSITFLLIVFMFTLNPNTISSKEIKNKILYKALLEEIFNKQSPIGKLEESKTCESLGFNIKFEYFRFLQKYEDSIIFLNITGHAKEDIDLSKFTIIVKQDDKIINEIEMEDSYYIFQLKKDDIQIVLVNINLKDSFFIKQVLPNTKYEFVLIHNYNKRNNEGDSCYSVSFDTTIKFNEKMYVNSMNVLIDFMKELKNYVNENEKKNYDDRYINSIYN